MSIMLCDICKKNPATIHIQEISVNSRKTLHLCQECAAKKAQEDSSPEGIHLAEVLFNLSSQLGQSLQEVPNETPSPAKPELPDGKYEKLFCPVCGWDYGSFRKTGRLGCPDCYSAFSDVLKSMIPGMHRGTVHTGKSPLKQTVPTGGGKRRKSTADRKADADRLQALLDEAVAQERYEDAAVLRDQILSLTKKRETRRGKRA